MATGDKTPSVIFAAREEFMIRIVRDLLEFNPCLPELGLVEYPRSISLDSVFNSPEPVRLRNQFKLSIGLFECLLQGDSPLIQLCNCQRVNGLLETVEGFSEVFRPSVIDLKP